MIRCGVLWLAVSSFISINSLMAENLVLIFPQIADGGGIRSEIILTNPGSVQDDGTIEFRDSTGSPWPIAIDGLSSGSVAYSIPPAGVLRMMTDGVGIPKAGSATVHSQNTSSMITGTVIYGFGDFEVSVPSSPLSRAFHVYAVRNNTADSGIALVNPTDKKITVEAVLRENDGQQLADGTIPLDTGEQTAQFLEQLFGEVGENFQGSAHFYSEDDFAMVGLRQKTSGSLATLSGAPTAYLGIGSAGSLYAVDPIVGNLRLVPAGTFTQGSPSTEACRSNNEKQFKHTLTRDLAAMETEVSQQMWADLKAVQPSLPDDPSSVSGLPTLPVNAVSWSQTSLFANLLSLQSGLTRVYYLDASFNQPVTAANYQTDIVYADWNADGYRLPTEGEWEYSARATTEEPFSIDEHSYGSDTCESCTEGALPQLETVAWFCANSGPEPDPVGQKPSNAWGLADMHGNVWEWVWDWYEGDYPEGSATDYRGPATGFYRGLRGGHSQGSAWEMRSAYRSTGLPGGRSPVGGFRLVRSLK